MEKTTSNDCNKTKTKKCYVTYPHSSNICDFKNDKPKLTLKQIQYQME